MSTHDRILGLLQEAQIEHQYLTHPAEGQTVRASRLRGHRIEQAAKALVLRIKRGKSGTALVLAVLPGHLRVDFGAVKCHFDGTSADFADRAVAEEITGCPMGGVAPFSFRVELKLVADPALLAEEKMVFSAGRLDASVFVATRDYLRLARPELVAFARAGPVPSRAG